MGDLETATKYDSCVLSCANGLKFTRASSFKKRFTFKAVCRGF